MDGARRRYDDGGTHVVLGHLGRGGRQVPPARHRGDAHGLTATSRLRRSLEIDHTTPPTWPRSEGAQRAEGHGDSITVWWNGADDPSEPIRYNIYYSTTTPIDFETAPVETSVVAAAGGGYEFQYMLGGLDPGCIRYHLAVRAVDAAFLANEDSNAVEVSAVTQYFTPNTGVSWGLDELAADAGPEVIEALGPAHQVHCSIRVSPRDTLVLSAGQVVQFDTTDVYAITVRGGFYADGLPGNSITFQSVQADTGRARWRGLFFTEGSHGSISWCSFKNAENAVNCGTPDMQVTDSNFSDCRRGVVTWGGAAIDIRQNTLGLCTTGLEIASSAEVGPQNSLTSCGTGIHAGTAPHVFENTVQNSVQDGIVLIGSGPETVVENNQVQMSGRYGIMLGPFYMGGCAAQVLANTVQGSGSSGIMCWPGTQALIGRDSSGVGNLIANNTGPGVECRDASPRIVGNTIRLNGGNGLLLYGFSQLSRPVVSGNVIQSNNTSNGNLVGVQVSAGALPVLGNLANMSTEDDGGNQISGHTWNLWNAWGAPIAAEGNYWGSTDSTTVDGKIRDDDENQAAGRVDFMPLITDPNAPDLSVGGRDITLARSGQDVQVQVRVRNIGITDADSVRVRVESPRDTLLQEVLLARVPAESLAVAQVAWSGAAARTSVDSVWVEVDPLDAIAERTELNNLGFAVIASPQLDLDAPATEVVWTGEKRIAWHATSPAGRALRYDVAWRSDSVSAWTDLATGLGASEHLWDTRAAPNGFGAQVRVRADDGVRLTETVSDASINLRNDFPNLTGFGTGAGKPLARAAGSIEASSAVEDTTLVFSELGDSLTVVAALPESSVVTSAVVDIEISRQHYVDQQQTDLLHPFARSEVSGPRRVFQVLRPSETRLSRLEVLGQGVGGRWSAELRDVLADVPGDSVLGRVSVHVEASEDPGWIVFDFGDVSVAPGTSVCVVLDGEGGFVETYNECGIGETCDAYTGGHCGFSVDGGEVWDPASSKYDLAFRAYAPFVPQRVALNVGADDDDEWSAATPPDTVFNLTGLAAEIGEFVSMHADADDGIADGMIDVPFRVEASDSLSVRLVNLTITYLDRAAAALGEEQFVQIAGSGEAWVGYANLGPRTYYVGAVAADGSVPRLRLFGPGLRPVGQPGTTEWLQPFTTDLRGPHLLRVQGSAGSRAVVVLHTLATLPYLDAQSDTTSGQIVVGGGTENFIDVARVQASRAGTYTLRLESVDAGVTAWIYGEDGTRVSGGTQSGAIFWSDPAAFISGESRLVAWAGSGSGSWQHRTACFEGERPDSISIFAGDGDADSSPDSLGVLVTVEGVALCDRYTFVSTGGDVSLDDDTAGIGLWLGSSNPASVARGDRVVARGPLLQIDGRNVLSDPIVTVVSSGNAIPDTLVTTSGTLAAGAEAFESRLASVTGVSITAGTWPSPGASGTVVIDDGSGSLTLEIASQTDLDEAGAPVGAFDVVGIVVQSDSTPPFTSGYRLRPRSAADITNANHAPGSFTLAGPGDSTVVATQTPALTWSLAADPDGDPVTYDLSYWAGAVQETTRVTGLTDTTYVIPSPLENGIFHSWSVTALDSSGAARVAGGAPWRFRVLAPLPELELQASSVSGVVFRGDTTSVYLVVQNIGGAPLAFSFTEQATAAKGPLSNAASMLAAKSERAAVGSRFAIPNPLGSIPATPIEAALRARASGLPRSAPAPGAGSASAAPRKARRRSAGTPAAPMPRLATDIAWLAVDPTAGTLATDSTLSVRVDLLGTLAAGTYAATLQLATNDPDEGSVGVPVEMRVPLYRFADHQAGRIQLTVTDGGALGYWDGANAQSFGAGLRFPTPASPNHLFHGSIFVATDSAHVLDTGYDRDWEPRLALVLTSTDPEIYEASFTDSLSPAVAGLRITQRSLAPGTPPDDTYVILTYEITASGDASFPAYVGLYLDLDVGEQFDHNAGAYDAGRGLGYLYNTQGSPTTWVGAVSLDGAPPASFHFIHNPTHVWPTGNLPDSTKWDFLSSGSFDPTTPDSARNDWSLLLSSGPLLLAPGSKARVAYALVAGQSLAELESAADVARQNLTSYVTGVGAPPVYRLALRQNYPNPFNPTTRVDFELPRPARARLSVFDVRGRLVARLVDRRIPAGRHNVVWDGHDSGGKLLGSGVYFYRLDVDGHGSRTRKMLLLK
ncbi:MAG: right-handed parallel beta-helix repeat-containing protein [Candidatus Krumholzibacteriia bacterium]